MELATAITWFDRSHGLLVMSSIGIVLASWGIHHFGNAKEEYLKQDLAVAHERTAKLEQEAALARERTAAVERDAAKANLAIEQQRAETANALERIANAELRAAEANQKAEEERLARVKIEQRLAPRSLTPAQMQGLVKRLKATASRPVDILQIGGTPEIAGFRSLLEQALRNAAWQSAT